MFFRSIPIVVLISAMAYLPASAQDTAPAAAADTTDPAARNIVTSYSVKSGKLMLSSASNPGPVQMPDGTYSNESGTVIVFLDGTITRVQRAERITEITNVRLNRQKTVLLTPSTNALMSVSDMNLPSGTFKTEDGKYWLRVVIGRPAEFGIDAAKAPQQ